MQGSVTAGHPALTSAKTQPSSGSQLSDVQRFPHALRDAITALENSKMARHAFGDDVIDHYLNYARTEQELFDKVVTDYERERLFERG